MLFRTIILIMCLACAGLSLIDYIDAFAACGYDINFLIAPQNIFALTTIVCAILIAIFLLTYKLKPFLVVFGIYVTAEFGSALYTSLDLFLIGNLFQSFSEITIQAKLYLICNFIIVPIVLGCYAVLYLISLGMYFKRNVGRFNMVKKAVYAGIVIAAVNIVCVFVKYLNYTDGFTFFDIFSDILFELFFSLIYISVPKYLVEVF